jgi:hypothetical protein
MSWVIARHLYKSGDNNICWRIGNYNKFSYSNFLKKKEFSQKYKHSRQYKLLQSSSIYHVRRRPPRGVPPFEVVTHKRILRLLDKYISYKSMSMWIDPELLYTYKLKLLNEWGHIYGYQITNIIFKKCYNITSLNHKYNYDFKRGDAKKFNQLSFTIIQKHNRLLSFSNENSSGNIPFLSEYSTIKANRRFAYWIRRG